MDNNGNVLIGQSASSSPGSGNTTQGVAIRGAGDQRSFFSVSNEYVAAFNRSGNNGSIIEFNKSGSHIGTIGVEGNDALYIESGTTSGSGLHFHPTAGVVRPARNGSTIDNAIELGTANRRFVDLHLSGGVYLGGTASANKLDDYEEGTWSPSINLPGATVGSYGKYTKIGNLVYIAGAFGWSGHSGSAVNVVIGGLPFNGVDNSDAGTRPSAFPEGDLVNMGTVVDNYGHFRVATSQMQGVRMSGGNTIYMSSSNFSATGEFNFSVMYYA